MALNLVRNSRVFFTTNVNATSGVINNTAFASTDTFEIQVLDGFTFSQNTNQDTITISEAGTTPVRGQRSFNTSLAPVDFSFSTYIRPALVSSAVTAEEAVLWNALTSTKNIDASGKAFGGTPTVAYTYANGTGTLVLSGLSIATLGMSVDDAVIVSGLSHATAATEKSLNSAAIIKSITPTNGTSVTSITLEYVNPVPGTVSSITASATNSFLYNNAGWASVSLPTASTKLALSTVAGSNKNQLQSFGLLFLIDQVLYAIDNCAMAQVSLDFGLDGIATAAWTGQATAIRKLADGASAGTSAFASNTSSVGAATVGTPTGSASSWSATVTVTAPVASNMAVGNSVTATGTPGAFGTGSVITAITYTNGLVSTFTVSSTTTATAGAITGATATTYAGGGFAAKNTTAGYLTNKLSTVSLTVQNAMLNSSGATVASNGTKYSLALTGGSVTINNNISYITPANLGVVNAPVKYYTGTRAISGSLMAYLKTGGGVGDTGQLLTDMLSASSVTTEPMFTLSLSIGGSSSATTRVDLDMPAVVLSIPTVDVQQVISTAINFTAQGSTPTGATSSVYDLGETNDIAIRYYAT
jgi:hypothetical protein